MVFSKSWLPQWSSLRFSSQLSTVFQGCSSFPTCTSFCLENFTNVCWRKHFCGRLRPVGIPFYFLGKFFLWTSRATLNQVYDKTRRFAFLFFFGISFRHLQMHLTPPSRGKERPKDPAGGPSIWYKMVISKMLVQWERKKVTKGHWKPRKLPFTSDIANNTFYQEPLRLNCISVILSFQDWWCLVVVNKDRNVRKLQVICERYPQIYAAYHVVKA